MFADDIDLVRELVAKFDGGKETIVDAGGLERPCIADYQITIDAMAKVFRGYYVGDERQAMIAKAQESRYQNITRPLSFLGDYAIENPETGGKAIEDLHVKYDHSVGTMVCLSTLEHVADPFKAVRRLRMAMRPGGLCIVSVPFQFPHHPSPVDHWRFSPTGLEQLFDVDTRFEVLACDWRLRIPASAGVLDIRTGQPQAIETAYLCARAV